MKVPINNMLLTLWVCLFVYARARSSQIIQAVLDWNPFIAHLMLGDQRQQRLHAFFSNIVFAQFFDIRSIVCAAVTDKAFNIIVNV